MAVPDSIQVPSTPPTNMQSVALQLTDIILHLQQWVAIVSNEFAALELRIAALEAGPTSSETPGD